MSGSASDANTLATGRRSRQARGDPRRPDSAWPTADAGPSAPTTSGSRLPAAIIDACTATDSRLRGGPRRHRRKPIWPSVHAGSPGDSRCDRDGRPGKRRGEHAQRLQPVVIERRRQPDLQHPNSLTKYLFHRRVRCTTSVNETEEHTMIDFTGQVAVVTGAGRGLGRLYALEMARRGAAVVVNDLGGSMRGDGADAASPTRWSTRSTRPVVARGRLARLGGQPRGRSGDHRCRGGSFGRLDAVVSNAGIFNSMPFEELSPDDWRRMLRVHLDGGFYLPARVPGDEEAAVRTVRVHLVVGGQSSASRWRPTTRRPRPASSD